MSDLTAKFGGLQTLLSNQHDDLMTALNATNAKLDALLEAFGVPPPVPGVTLADIKAVLDDIHLDTQSIDLKLLRVRDAIAPLGEDLPEDEKSSIAWSIYRIMDSTAPAWPRPTSVPLQPALELLRQAFADVVGINADGTAALTVLGRLTSLLDSSGNIEDHIGQPTGDATTTVLGRLAAIERLSECNCGPQPPDPTDPAGCADPFVSIPMAESIAAYPGRTFAVFPSPVPDGLVVTDSMDLGVVGVEISPEATWTGWRVFVLSSAAKYYSEDPTRTGLWPTNVWRDLDEAQSYALAFSVPAGDIAVYLCGPEVEPPAECYTWPPATMDTVITAFGNRIRPSGELYDLTPAAVGDGTMSAFSGDWNDWTYSATGKGIQAYYYADGGSLIALGTTSESVSETISGTIPSLTAPYNLLFQSYIEEFAMELCPPEPS